MSEEQAAAALTYNNLLEKLVKEKDTKKISLGENLGVYETLLAMTCENF